MKRRSFLKNSLILGSSFVASETLAKLCAPQGLQLLGGSKNKLGSECPPSIPIINGSSLTYLIAMSGAGRIGVYTGYRLYKTAGPKVVWVKRSHGTAGAVSVSYNIVAGLNGRFSGASTGTISWSNGEGGYKAIIVDCSLVSTGVGFIYVSLSNPVGGALLACTEYCIAIEDGSIPLGDHSIFVSASGNDSTGNGTLSMPYKTIKRAKSFLSSSKRMIVLRGGIYNLDDEDSFTLWSQQGGVILPAPVGGLQLDHSTRVYFCRYPGETPVLDGSVRLKNPNTVGFGCRNGNTPSGSGNYCTVFGLEIRFTNGANNRIYNTSHFHILSCHMHHAAGADGDNVGALFNEDNSDIIVAGCRLHDFSVGGSSTNNNAAGQVVYRSVRVMFSNNTVTGGCNHGIYHKQTPDDQTAWQGCDHANFIYGTNESAFHWSEFSSSRQAKNFDICGNLVVQSNNACAVLHAYGSNSASWPNATDVCIEHNTFITNRSSVNLYKTVGSTMLGNLIVSSSDAILFGPIVPVIKKHDYNLIFASNSIQYTGNNGSTNYSGHAAIEIQYGAGVETNSNFAVAPSFTSATSSVIENRNYRLASNSAGKSSAHDGADCGAYFLPDSHAGVFPGA